MLSVCGLLLLWFTLRTLKYFFVTGVVLSRYIWYLYYIPMLLIPLLGVIVSLSLGKPESYRHSKWVIVLIAPTLVLLTLVLTNDLHQWVFSFPEGAVWTDKFRKYEPCYWLVFGWQIFCAAASLLMMIAKCRMPKSRKMYWLPIIALGCSVTYAVMRMLFPAFPKLISGDLTATQSVIYICILRAVCNVA